MIVAVAGQGRWAGVICSMLDRLGYRPVRCHVSRRPYLCSELQYRETVRASLRCLGDIDILWVAVPPGNQYAIVEEALLNGINVVVEKPWMVSSEKTAVLVNLAESRGLRLAVNYQYCYLDELRSLSEMLSGRNAEWRFRGTFTSSREDKLNVSAEYNLGQHIKAIWYILFRFAKLDGIESSYGVQDKREVVIFNCSEEYVVDFTDNKQPIIERLFEDFRLSLAENGKRSLTALSGLNGLFLEG